MAAATTVATAVVCEASSSSSSTKQQQEAAASWFDTWKQQRIGHYENRVRAFSHPLKVFQYFASVRSNNSNSSNTMLMTPLDFVLSIVPFHPSSSSSSSSAGGGGSGRGSASRKRLLQKCQSGTEFFKLADTDGDGLISYDEYLFFLTLLATPEHQFRLAFQLFDKDGNGVVDLEEFLDIVNGLPSAVKARQGQHQRDKVLKAKRSGLLVLFFGKSGKDPLTFERFEAFLRQLQEEVLKIEFYSFDVDDNDTISYRDFAQSLISYASPPVMKEYQKRVDTLPEYKERMTFRQFAQFNSILTKMDDIEYAVQLFSTAKDPVGTKELRRAIKAATNVSLTDTEVSVLFHVFDRNQDGTLDHAEFVDIVRQRLYRGLDRERDTGLFRWFQKLALCIQTV